MVSFYLWKLFLPNPLNRESESKKLSISQNIGIHSLIMGANAAAEAEGDPVYIKDLLGHSPIA